MRNMSKRKLSNQAVALIVCFVIFAVLIAGLIINYTNFTNNGPTPLDRISRGVIPTSVDLANAKAYKRVVIFGVDGAGGMFPEANTPNFDEIFENGSVSFTGMSQYPTISAQNWGSMLLGVTAQKHNLTNSRTAIFKNDGKYESIFKIVSKLEPYSSFYSCLDWKNINHGIIEDDIPNMTKVNVTDLIKPEPNEYNIDRKVAELTAERVASFDDKIVFVHFDAVDHAGHAHGSSSQEYLDAIEENDKDIGIIYQAYKDAGKVDDTLFICVSDHGHKEKGGHGGESDIEKAVTIAVAGNKGNIIKGTPGYYVTQDMAAIVLYALGIAQPSTFEGRVPTNLFNTIGA